MLTIDRAMFITNIFATAYPELHTSLWNEFEKEVPTKQRSGYFGADNLAYITWLKKKNHPVFTKFVNEAVDIRTF